MGCSYPGINRIINKAIKEFIGELYLVIGGFHSSSHEELNYLIRNINWKIAPLHYSGFNTIKYIKNKAPNKLLIGGFGLEITLDPLKLS